MKTQADCPFEGKCWRFAYSRYLQDNGEYPEGKGTLTRQHMFLMGYASMSMVRPRGKKKKYGGLFAENFPHIDKGEKVNMCPHLVNRASERCEEYEKEQARLAQLSKPRKAWQREGKTPREHIPKPLREKVCRRDKFRCVFCHRYHGQLWNGVKVRIVVDHFYPLARGGNALDEGNLVVACHQCNHDKSDDIWELGCRVGYYNKTGAKKNE